MTIQVNGGVEGPIDQAILARLVADAGAQMGRVYGLGGKRDLLRKLKAYNNAARHSPWAVLVDLDEDAACAPTFAARHLPRPSSWMCFRVAVRAAEAWLLADHVHLAEFLGVTAAKVPFDPEAVADPKQTLVNLARRSSKRDVRLDMVPRQASGREVGPAYVSRLIEFVADERNGWQPRAASLRAPSLSRAIDCLSRLSKYTGPR